MKNFQCDCNIDKFSPKSEEIKQYSKTSFFLLLFGISMVPKQIDYKCKVCDKIYETLTKEEIK